MDAYSKLLVSSDDKVLTVTPRENQKSIWLGPILTYHFHQFDFPILDSIPPFIVLQNLSDPAPGKVKCWVDLGCYDGRMMVRKRYETRNISVTTALRIQREVLTLIVLKHPYILNIHMVAEEGNILEFYSDYCSQGDLCNLIKADKINNGSRIKIFSQILEAVAFCHYHRIIHRDIKPENILIDENGDVKLADFGYCTVVSLKKQHRSSIGTMFYASPEILSGGNYTGIEVDSWSLGCLFYVIMHGYIPFDSSENVDVQLRNIRKRPICRLDLDIEVVQMINGLLDLNPENRLTPQQCLQSSLWPDIRAPSDYTDSSSSSCGGGSSSGSNGGTVKEIVKRAKMTNEPATEGQSREPEQNDSMNESASESKMRVPVLNLPVQEETPGIESPEAPETNFKLNLTPSMLDPTEGNGEESPTSESSPKELSKEKNSAYHKFRNFLRKRHH